MSWRTCTFPTFLFEAVLQLREECRTLRAKRRKVFHKDCCSIVPKWEHSTPREAYSLTARAVIWEMGDTSLFPSQWDRYWRLVSYLRKKNRRKKIKMYDRLSQTFPLVKHMRWMWLISKHYKYCRNVPVIWSCKLAELLTLLQLFFGMAHQCYERSVFYQYLSNYPFELLPTPPEGEDHSFLKVSTP